MTSIKNIRNIIILLTCFLLTHNMNAQVSSDFQTANSYYDEQEYDKALEAYQLCLQENEGVVLSRKSKAQVYYNMGNAYFKQGNLSQSILAYERCLRLQPRNKDAKYNLEIAQSRIIDNLTDNSSFFVAKWAKAIRDLLTEQAWIVVSICLFLLTLIGILVFALSHYVSLRKASFHTAWIALILSIISFFNAGSLHHRDTDRTEAIITQGILNAKSSPDKSGTDLFTLHEGTKVNIKETLGDWCNISVGNNEGWIQTSHLERI